jgi:serine/threonine-protein kinase
MRAIEKDPAARYQTALAFAEALEDAATEAGVLIATPRAVTAFVLEMQAHERPDLTGMDEPSNTPLSIPSRVASVPSSVSAPPVVPSGQEAVSTTHDVASVVLSHVPPSRAGSRRKYAVFGAIGGGVVVGGLILAGALATGGDHPTPALSAAETAAPVTASVAPPASVALPTPTASAAGSAASAPSAAPVASSAPAAIKAPPRSGPHAAPTPRTGPTAFRPSDL